MKVPFSWLKEYVDIDCNANELAEKLFASGFEVEEIVDLEKSVENIVVGKIVAIDRHPNADKLQVCQIDCGKYGNAIQILTAAKNVAVGDFVPVALHDSKTANGMHILTTKMRGVDSFGMLCSGEELGIGEEFYTGAAADGILILQGEQQVGQAIQAVVGLDDIVLDIAITANRPDCQSIYGIAREIAALLDKPLKMLDTSYTTIYSSIEHLPKMIVTMGGLNLCRQYMGQVLQDVVYKESPKWMQRRLALCGMRAKNAVVDITNYILLELGQPLHAFDVDNIQENIVLRQAENGEKAVLLNEKEVTLTEKQLVIADNEKVLALAGIMGSQVSAVNINTKNIFLECATFDRANIRRSAKAMSMRTDASARYEKGVDSYTGLFAMKRALHFFDNLEVAKVVQEFSAITEIQKCSNSIGSENMTEVLKILPVHAGGLVGKISGYIGNDYQAAIRIVDKTYGYRESIEQIQVQTSYRKINALLGIKVSESKIKNILERLSFTVQEIEGNRELGNIDYKLIGKCLEHRQILVTAPAFREDIEGYADLAEEVIRLYGYQHVKKHLLQKAEITHGGLNAQQQFYNSIKDIFVGQAYQESITFSFISPKDYLLFAMEKEAVKSVTICNPIGEDFSMMRTTLLPSMLQAVSTNMRKNNRAVRLFECANVYKKDTTKILPQENMTLAFALYGENESFYTAKGAFAVLEEQFALKFDYRVIKNHYFHHGRAAEVFCNGQVIGCFGELAPTLAEELSIEYPVYLGEIYLHILEKKCNQKKYFTKLAKFSDMYRDISLLMPQDITCKAIEDVIYSTDSSITNVKLFDTYMDKKLGENKKSLAFTITFENVDRERKPEEIDSIMQQVVNNLQQKLNIVRR